jgi:hypothetical protein
LRSWRDFFPNATIYGIDVQPDTQFDDEDRIVTFLCDSTDRSQVDRLMERMNGKEFDIILDDGSHRLEDQIATLRNLYRFVKEGGTYVVEDVVNGALVHHQDKIRAVCGDDPFFFNGSRNNPLVIMKRPGARADVDARVAHGAGPQPSGAPVADRSSALRKAAADEWAGHGPLSRQTFDPRLNFIVGVPRSGTTLFRAMLGAHPRICAPSETPWLCGAYDNSPSLRELLRYLATGGDGPVKNIQDVAVPDVTRAAKRFLLELFDSKLKHDKKDILVLKTPDDIWFVDDLIQFFPHAKILHVRRDVRDVALSTVNSGWRTLNHFGLNSFENAVGRWIACERKIADLAKSNTNIASFRFEELVTQPEIELDRAAKFLGVSFDAKMLDYVGHLTDAPAWELGSRDVKRHGSVKAARAWAYRSAAPTDEQRRVIEVNAAKIAVLGYSGGWQSEETPPTPDTAL